MCVLCLAKQTKRPIINLSCQLIQCKWTFYYAKPKLIPFEPRILCECLQWFVAAWSFQDLLSFFIILFTLVICRYLWPNSAIGDFSNISYRSIRLPKQLASPWRNMTSSPHNGLIVKIIEIPNSSDSSKCIFQSDWIQSEFRTIFFVFLIWSPKWPSGEDIVLSCRAFKEFEECSKRFVPRHSAHVGDWDAPRSNRRIFRLFFASHKILLNNCLNAHSDYLRLARLSNKP